MSADEEALAHLNMNLMQNNSKETEVLGKLLRLESPQTPHKLLFQGCGLEGAIKRRLTSSLSSEDRTVQKICKKLLRNPNQ